MKRVTRTLLCALFFSTLIAPVSHADSDTALLTICTSLKSGYQLISKTGKCNERIYEARTWFQKGSALYGTPGSTMLDMRTCIRKSSKVQIIGTRAACNSKIYTTALWQRPLGPSVAPSITSVAMGLLGTATLNIAAPIEDGGAKVTSYLVTSTPGQLTATYTPAQIKAAKITGLTPGSSYSFSVVAINIKGPSPSSIASASTLAPTIPSAPSITKVIATGTNSAQLSFSPPLDNGGLPITSYVATSSPGSLQTTVYQSAGGTINITNLSHSTSYTFTLTAINAAGSSLPSAISPSITTATPPPPPEPVAPTPSVSALAAPAFTLSASSENRTVNTAATGFTINSTGGAIASFAISATPAGMSFSTSTGALTGTPTSVAGATAYTVTATNAAGSATQTFTLTVAAAATAAAITTQPTGAASGSTLATQPVIRIVDANGNTVTSSSVSVVASIASGTGTLSGTTTVAASSGIATFTNLVITGTAGNFTLTFTPTSLTPVTSSALAIATGAASKYVVTSSTYSPTAGAAMTISAQLTDANGNAVATSGKTVTWSKSNANGSFATATSTTDASGIATISFTTHTVSATATTVTATDNSSFTGTTPTITTATGAATAAVITTQPTGAASGSQLETQPVIRIVDASGNTVTSSTVSVVASIASGSGTLSGTTTVTASSGIATFTNLVITATAGNFTLTFTPTSLTPVTSSSLSITTTTISAPAIAGVTAPVRGATPVSTTTAGTGYTGTVTWSGSPVTFAPGTTYTATITLTPTSGYTLTGVTANFFTVAGATPPVTNSANAGVITAVFPATAYILGDTGPGGGKIFYVAATTFACGPTLAASCKYLEAAPNTWFGGGSDPTRVWGEWDKFMTSSSWGRFGTPHLAEGYVEGTLSAIGTGYKNSLDMIENADNTYDMLIFENSAVAAARAYRGPYNLADWFLPSIAELNELFSRQETVGGFAEGIYWSSTEGEVDDGDARIQTFPGGNAIDGVAYKEETHYVRPVRAF